VEETKMGKQTDIMVVVGREFRRSAAVLRALSLARRSGAGLQLRSFEYSRALDRAASRGFDLAAYLRGRQAEFEDFTAGLRDEGVQAECKVIWGHPLAERVVFEAMALKPAMVIKDTPRHSDPELAALNSLDWRLLGECPAPLMLVRPDSPSLPLRIAAAVDPLDEHGKPHELNHGILRAATTLASQCEAGLDVVNAFEYIPSGGEWEYAGWIPDLTLYGELRKIHAEGLFKLGKEHGVPPSAMHILDGEASDCIVRFAAGHRADLLVMGSIYRTGLKRLLLGSTAEGVFDTLGCDILLIKPEGFSAELQALLESGEAKAA
jgi:universal stress protein E